MTHRFTHLLTSTALALSALAMSGCALIESNVSGVTLGVLEDGFTPPTLQLADVDMACNFSTVSAPLVGAARNFYGDPSLVETVMLSSAGVCAETHAVNDELRYLRAARDKHSDEAQDARVSQKRWLTVAAQRQYASYTRMRTKLEQKYFFKYGSTCPKFKRDFDELAYLLGSLAGLEAMQNDIAAQQAVGVPTDIAPLASLAMACLDDTKWWGVPRAVRATVSSLIPGAAEGKDLKATFTASMNIGEAKGVRLAHVLAATAAQSADDKQAVRDIIKRFSNVKNFTPNPDYRLIDSIAQAQIVMMSDRLWTQATGSRTPISSLGKFWDDQVETLDVDNLLK